MKTLDDYLKKSHLTLRQASDFLGCPTHFIKSEIKRQRLFVYFHWFRPKLMVEDLIKYKNEILTSVVWKDFANNGYIGKYKPNTNHQ